MGQIAYEGLQTADTVLVTTAETVVCTLLGVNTPRKTNVFLRAWAQVTTGTNTTALVIRIRRGTTVAGTLIGEQDPVTIGAAAGGTEEIECAAIDGNVDLAAASYVVTVSQTGATANGNVTRAGIRATMEQ